MLYRVEETQFVYYW